MERLVCWTLMGLRQNGPHEVWYQLATFPNADQAKTAASDPHLAEQGIIKTQVMPYYRVDSEQETTRGKKAAKSIATAV